MYMCRTISRFLNNVRNIYNVIVTVVDNVETHYYHNILLYITTEMQ